MRKARKPSLHEPTASVGAFRAVLAVANQLKPGTARALQQEFLSGMNLDDVDVRGPAALLPEIFATASKLTGADDFGFRVAEATDVQRLGLVGYVVGSSSSLRAAYERTARYLALWNEGSDVNVVDEASLISVTWHPRGEAALTSPLGQRIQAECVLATLVGIGRSFIGRPLIPERVEFAFKAPASIAAHQRVFAAPLVWESPVTRMVFTAQALEAAPARYDAALHEMLARHADELLSKLGTASLWTSRAQKTIVGLLSSGTPDIGQVAKSLAISRRTLQRRLELEGITFEELLDRVRHEASTRLLTNPENSISDVAWLVGYRELSAFYRAFKRWCGNTPAEYRKRLVPAGANGQ